VLHRRGLASHCSEVGSGNDHWRRVVLSAGLIVAIALIDAAVASAVTITVDSLADDTNPGHCTLREAINSNQLTTPIGTCATGTGTDTIQFSVTGDILLGSLLPTIAAGTLTISGPTASPGITIDGGGTVQIAENFTPGNLTLKFLTLANGSELGGGAIGNVGNLTVTNCTFRGNQATSVALFGGGAILNRVALTVMNSTFTSNRSAMQGGAIINLPLGFGLPPPTMSVTNSTFSGNQAAITGGALFNAGIASVEGSILVDSTGGDCAGTAITNLGGNIADDATCGFGTSTGANGQTIGDNIANPGLDPAGLANNGGPTETIALLASSVAINAIALADCPATDQRGFPRPGIDTSPVPACDSGAYELQGPKQIEPLGHRVAIESYYDVASSAQVSAGGYGGPGHSGGAGDALIRLVDVGNFGVTSNKDPGALCANFYVFDDDQQEQACCSCLVTANGTTTTSVITNLISNPAFQNAKMSLGAVKVVGSFGTCTNTPPTAATLTAANLAEGLKGWINHAEKIATNLPPSFAFVTSTSLERLAGAPLDSGELTELTSNCAAIVHQASGAGICSCGVGL